MCNLVGEYPEISSPLGITMSLGEVDVISDRDSLSATSGNEIVRGGIIVDHDTAKQGPEAMLESGPDVTPERPSASRGAGVLGAVKTYRHLLPQRGPTKRVHAADRRPRFSIRVHPDLAEVTSQRSSLTSQINNVIIIVLCGRTGRATRDSWKPRQACRSCR
jgi:hypothetical protein